MLKEVIVIDRLTGKPYEGEPDKDDIKKLTPEEVAEIYEECRQPGFRSVPEFEYDENGRKVKFLGWISIDAWCE